MIQLLFSEIDRENPELSADLVISTNCISVESPDQLSFHLDLISSFVECQEARGVRIWSNGLWVVDGVAGGVHCSAIRKIADLGPRRDVKRCQDPHGTYGVCVSGKAMRPSKETHSLVRLVGLVQHWHGHNGHIHFRQGTSLPKVKSA